MQFSSGIAVCPIKKNCLREKEGVKKVQNLVHMIFERPRLQVTNNLSGIHGLSRPLKSSHNKYHETRITQHLAQIFHSHRCLSKDKGSVKNCGTVQTAVSTLS